MREMILAKDGWGAGKRWRNCCPCRKKDFKGIFAAMDGFPVTVRLLDPPLHEFVPR
jgi:pyruvate,orthophosphate dikinase